MMRPAQLTAAQQTSPRRTGRDAAAPSPESHGSHDMAHAVANAHLMETGHLKEDR